MALAVALCVARAVCDSVGDAGPDAVADAAALPDRDAVVEPVGATDDVQLHVGSELRDGNALPVGTGVEDGRLDGVAVGDALRDAAARDPDGVVVDAELRDGDALSVAVADGGPDALLEGVIDRVHADDGESDDVGVGVGVPVNDAVNDAVNDTIDDAVEDTVEELVRVVEGDGSGDGEAVTLKDDMTLGVVVLVIEALDVAEGVGTLERLADRECVGVVLAVRERVALRDDATVRVGDAE